MMKYLGILEICALNDKTVKKFNGKKKYIATADVMKSKVIGGIDVLYSKKPSRANRRVEIGDILFAKMKNTNKVLLINEDNKDYIYSTGFVTIKPDEKVVLKEYIYYLLKSDYFQNIKDEHSSGATQKAINNKGLKQIKIPVPSIKEQKHFISIIKKINFILDTRKYQIKALSSLKLSIFEDAFGNPNNNLKKWPKEMLGKHLDTIKGGWSPKCHPRTAKENEWGVLIISAVTQGEFNDKLNKALPSNINEKEELEVRKNDLLFNRKNTPELVGTSSFVYETRPKLIFPDTIFRIEAKESLNKIFLWQLLNHPLMKKNIKNLATGSAKSMSNISQKKLKELEIIIPDLAKQEEFARLVQDIDHKINVLSKSERDVNLLYDSLLYKYFNGNLIREELEA